MYVTGNQNPVICVFFLHLLFFRIFKVLAWFSKYDFWNLEKILGLYRKKSVNKYFMNKSEKILNKTKKHVFLKFFQIQNADTLIRSYHIKHDFHLKFIDFPVIFKDNLETLFLAEACLSFPECSEQFLRSLET